jgi:anti-anti-sigma factor
MFASTSLTCVKFTTEWLTPSEVLISAVGDIDASNASALTHYVFRHAANSQALTLDLSHVDFFGTAGFEALREIGVGCARAGVKWALKPSPAVTRVLEICERRGAFLSSTG